MTDAHRPDPVNPTEPSPADKESASRSRNTDVARGGQVNPEERHAGLSSTASSRPSHAKPESVTENPGEHAQQTADHPAAEQEPIGPTHR
jgi:hypothetical protein